MGKRLHRRVWVRGPACERAAAGFGPSYLVSRYGCRVVVNVANIARSQEKVQGKRECDGQLRVEEGVCGGAETFTGM